MAKKALKWTEIEARYKAGEKPRDIAKEYKNCTADKISQKANRDGWTKEKKEIQQKVNAFVESETKALAQRVLKEYERLAFSNMRNYAKWSDSQVSLERSETLDEDLTAAVVEISQTVTKDGGTVRFKLANKQDALDSLAKHLGIFEAKPDDSSEEDGMHITLEFTQPSQAKKKNQRAAEDTD